MRDGKQAVDLALKACQATQWKTWNLVGTLAAAYAEAGDFDQAIKYQKQVMVMPDVPEGERANQKMRLSLFEQRKPTHEDPH